MSVQGFTVTCEDGKVRHPHPFTSRTDASYFAEWGHCCTARHEITEAPIPPADLFARTERTQP